MSKSTNLLTLMMAMLVLTSLTLVSATVINPSSGATVSSTAILNATNTSMANMVNCSFYAKSASTANSSWGYLALATNVSTNPLSINVTFDSAVLEDSNDYIFNASCRNRSNYIYDSLSTGVIVNNTIPTAPTSLSPASGTVDDDGTVSFSSTVTGARTTGCTLIFNGGNPGQSSYTMTHSGNTCTYSLASIPEQTFKWYIRASDGTDTANSAERYFEVDMPTRATKTAAILQSQGGAIQPPTKAGGFFTITGGSTIGGMNPTALIIILAIGLGVFFLIKRK